MAQSINLIPQKEKLEQTKTQLVKASTIVAVVFVIVVSGIAAYYFYITYNIKQQIAALDSSINDKRKSVQNLSEVEILARNLDSRYEVLKDILTTRPHYSLLLSEMQKRVPKEVKIENLTLASGGTMNVSGVGDSYVSIAKFISDLKSQSFPNGDPKLKALFTDVTLNSVNLENTTNLARFFIIIKYNTTLLNSMQATR